MYTVTPSGYATAEQRRLSRQAAARHALLVAVRDHRQHEVQQTKPIQRIKSALRIVLPSG